MRIVMLLSGGVLVLAAGAVLSVALLLTSAEDEDERRSAQERGPGDVSRRVDLDETHYQGDAHEEVQELSRNSAAFVAAQTIVFRTSPMFEPTPRYWDDCTMSLWSGMPISRQDAELLCNEIAEGIDKGELRFPKWRALLNQLQALTYDRRSQCKVRLSSEQIAVADNERSASASRNRSAQMYVQEMIDAEDRRRFRESIRIGTLLDFPDYEKFVEARKQEAWELYLKEWCEF